MNHIEFKISKQMTTLIDFDDYERLKTDNLLKWNAQKVKTTRSEKYYASRNIGKTKVYLHRYIMNCPDGFCIDHINGNSLDNRKINLRICSYRENARNIRRPVNGFKGVTKTKNGKWQAQIELDNTHLTLGVFTKESEAARVYDLAAAFLFKEYASFNFAFSKKFLKFFG